MLYISSNRRSIQHCGSRILYVIRLYRRNILKGSHLHLYRRSRYRILLYRCLAHRFLLYRWAWWNLNPCLWWIDRSRSRRNPLWLYRSILSFQLTNQSRKTCHRKDLCTIKIIQDLCHIRNILSRIVLNREDHAPEKHIH